MPAVTQDVLVLAVVERDDDLVVSVYGSDANLCGSITFDIPDAGERGRHRRTLEHWAQTDEPVSLLARGETMTLVADRALLRRAFD